MIFGGYARNIAVLFNTAGNEIDIIREFKYQKWAIRSAYKIPIVIGQNFNAVIKKTELLIYTNCLPVNFFD